jgi:hypothetical protein
MAVKWGYIGHFPDSGSLPSAAKYGGSFATAGTSGSDLAFYFSDGSSWSAGGGGASISAGIDADKPAAASGNAGNAYFSTDVNGGTLYRSNGTSWVQIAAAVNNDAGPTATTWASRGTGSYVGELKRITDLGNNALVMARWNGTYWLPDGGRQLIYNLQAPVTASSGISSQATIPSVTIPGGLMNVNGGFEIEIHTHTASDVVSVANTILYSFDGFQLFGTDNLTNFRLWMGRRVKNQNSASVQTVMSNASGTGAFVVTNNGPKATTKNTATDLVLAGTATATHGTSIQNIIDEFKVWWI